MDETQFPDFDKKALSDLLSFEVPEDADQEYWLSRTPSERLQYMEYLRRLRYGPAALGRIQKVLEIVDQE